MEYLRRIEHQTSVKSIGVIQEPTGRYSGIADFTFNPVFSVFDVGTIEPPVPLDNRTICLMQGFNFELLNNEGFRTHYHGLVDSSGREVSAAQVISSPTEVPDATRVDFVNRLSPAFTEGRWDYSNFHDGPKCYVHPIEFITRNSLPASSSVWGRGEQALSELGLPEGMKPGDAIPESLRPILDFSTKYEPHDRYVSPSEAQRILGVDDARFASINDLTRRASDLMTEYGASRGFERLDGKIEFITYIDGDGHPVDVLGDAVCTWHEDRLRYGDIGISKQRIRDKVKKLNPEWYAKMKNAKARAREEGHADFRDLMDDRLPPVMPEPAFFHAANDLFRAATNQWVGARVFDPGSGNNDSLEDALARAIERFERVR